jgi:hypothetical protein
MIIEIFILLLAITMIFILSGMFFDVPAMTVVGLAFLFMLGIIILNTGIEYRTGEILTENNLITTITYSYDTFKSNTYGIFVCVISIVWFIITMINLRRGQ